MQKELKQAVQCTAEGEGRLWCHEFLVYIDEYVWCNRDNYELESYGLNCHGTADRKAQKFWYFHFPDSFI